MTKKIHRRKFCQYSTGLLGLSGLPGIVFANSQTLERKFLLHIDLGSWCGWSSGLVQPNDIGTYPIGAFISGSTAGSPNPNINEHFKSGNFVFHNYSKPMLRHTQDLVTAVGNPLSITHGEAHRIQSTGVLATGGAGNPSWLMGTAHQFAKKSGQSGPELIISTKRTGTMVSGSNRASNAISLSAETKDEVASLSKDHSSVPGGDIGEAFRQLSKKSGNLYRGGGQAYSGQIAGFQVSLEKLSKEIPGLDAGFSEASAAITKAKIDAELTENPDGGAINASYQYEDIRNQFVLAATLIQSGAASGMAIKAADQDTHDPRFGTAAIKTARSAGRIWSMLAVFWDWVKSKGYEDKVMVIVSHEFSRTASNGQSIGEKVHIKNGNSTSEINITSFGTDHHPSFGMWFLNGRLQGGSRMGSMLDQMVVVGSSDLNGTPDPAKAAYTSTQIVANTLLTAWPELFVDQREMRNIWPNFGENDILTF